MYRTTHVFSVTGTIALSLFLSAGSGAQQRLAISAPVSAASSDPTITRTPTPKPAALQREPYTVGSGDVLNISVWKEKDLSSTVAVRPDGQISIPLIGEIEVAKLTPAQVEDLLKHRLESFVVQPNVTVSVVEIHSRTVYITGEVSRPGAYPLNAPLNVLQLIAQAGGLTEFASRKNIHVVHADPAAKDVVLDYKGLMRKKDAARNPELSPGDTVVIR